MVAPAPPYRVERMPLALRQIKEIAARLRGTRRTKNFAATLSRLCERIEWDPNGFGDPLHRTRHDGGTVCHRIFEHLAIRFVVFENEKVVFLLSVRTCDSYFGSLE